MSSLLQLDHVRKQYKEIRTALLTLKARYQTRKCENQSLRSQLVAFQKLVTRQCILIKEATSEISRLEDILIEYRMLEAQDCKSSSQDMYSTFGWNADMETEASSSAE
jgi:hypothetical protein